MLKVDFLNVGKGNCVVVKFPSGNLSVIDIDNSRVEINNPLQDPIGYLETNYPNESIFRFVLTHPDMDHLSGLNELNQKREIVNFWDTENNKTAEQTKMHLGGYNAADWQCYQQLREKSENPKVVVIHQESTPSIYWKEDLIQVLAPSKAMVSLANNTGEFNHCSYVLMIEYDGIKILLGGDATKESWRDILAFHGGTALKTDVFLAPHHGSPNNIEKDVFQHIDPDYVVVSDHYGHSYDYAYYNGLANKQVYSTKHFGNITVLIDGDNRRIYPERNG